MKTVRSTVLGIAFGMFLAGCGNNNNPSSFAEPAFAPPAPTSLSLTAINSPEKSVYRKGEPISVDFTVRSSDISANNIIVSFSIVPVTELDLLETGEPYSAPLGDFLIESITPGFATFQADLVIPNDLLGGGQDFVILGAVDPELTVTADVDFSDNISRGFTANFDHPTTKVITVTDTFINDLSIENAAAGEGFILLETPLSAVPGGKTVSNVVILDDDPRESNVVGHIDVKKLGADSMNAIIQVDVIVDGAETAAFMWKGENDEWVNEAPYDVPSPDDVHFIPWDIRLSPAQRDALFAAYDPSLTENIATFRFRIQQTSGAQDENPANNSFELAVPFRFFTPEAAAAVATEDTAPAAALASSRANMPLKTIAGLTAPSTAEADMGAFTVNANAGVFNYNKNYNMLYGDRSKFAVGINLDSTNGVNGPAGSGKIYNGATVTAYALGRSFELARAFGNAEANVLSLPATSGYQGYMKVFGRVVLNESASRTTDISRDWSLQWREEKTFARATFFAGPIPITISAGASGTMGFGAGLALSGAVIRGYGDVFFAQLDAYAEGGVNLGFASGGIRADLLLLSTRLRVDGAANLSNVLNRQVTLSAVAQSRLEAIRGTFYLFARYPTYRFCCSFPQKEARLTLYSTGSLFNKNWNLLNASKTVSF